MPLVPPLSLVRNGDVDDTPQTRTDAERIVRERFEATMAAVSGASDEVGLSFMAFERRLRDHVMALARAFAVLFLVLVEERVAASIPARLNLGGRTFRKAPAQTRGLNTLFGVVRYSRLYMREAPSKRRRSCAGTTRSTPSSGSRRIGSA